MEQQIELSAQIRTDTGKAYARKIRRQGEIPAVLYGCQDGSTLLSVDAVELKKIIKKGFNSLIQIKINGDEARIHLSMLKEVQKHPIKETIFHVDFLEVSGKANVEIALSIRLKGEPIGVKRDLGILEHTLRKLNVECPVDSIPEFVEVEITDLEVGSTIHVKDLVLGAGVKAKDDPEKTVVSIVASKGMEEAAEEGEGEDKAAEEEGS